MSIYFEQAKRLVLMMNATNTNLSTETRERCREMLKESEKKEEIECPTPTQKS